MNPRPWDYDSRALPTELHRHMEYHSTKKCCNYQLKARQTLTDYLFLFLLLYTALSLWYNLIMMASYNRILICRTDRIGDVLLTLPVITNLRLANEKAYIAFLGTEYSKKVLEDNPYLNEFIVYDPKGKHAGLGGLFRLTAEMRRAKFDTVLQVFPRFKVSLAAFLAGIPIRVGVSSRWYSFLYNKRAAIHRSKVEKHELEYNLDLLSSISVPIKDKNIALWLNRQDEIFAAEFIGKHGLSGKIVAVHPGGADGMLGNWSLEKYARLIEALREELKVKVILIEGKGEDKVTKKLFELMQNPPPVLKGSADIKQLGAVLKKMSIFISKNTGTMHIAAAVKTPTISLFSPVYVVSEKRWGPWGNKAFVIKPKLENCQKCTGNKCVHYNCLDMISVAEILEKVKLFL